MAVRSKTLGRIGSVITLLCLIFLLLSFASDHWLDSSGRDNTGFVNLGLWSVCFREYFPPSSAVVNRKYDGCWWVLNKELDDLREFLIPPWYKTTQILMSVGLVLVLIVCIMLIVNLINCFPYSPFRHVIKRSLALISSLGLFLTAILLSVSVLVFGIRSSNTGNGWLQNNDENSLSWSFGMGILASFLAMIAGMVLIMQFMRVRAEKDEESSEPKVILTNEPPPTPNYHYSHNTNRARPMPENSRDPAYVQRYSKADESKTSLISGPTELFAVSGRGEVYVNNLATYDETQPGRQQRPPPRREPQRVPAPRTNAQPVSSAPRGNGQRQLGRQGYPLRLQEPNFHGGGSQDGSVDGETRSSRHPSLPEYVPRKNKNEAATEEDSAELSDSDNTTTTTKETRRRKKRSKDEDAESVKSEGGRKSRSKSKSGNKSSRDRSRSNSRSRKKKKNDSDTEGDNTPSQRRRSKKRRGKSPKGESSDDERSQSRQRSRRRRSSKSRSRSRDRATSDSQLDSDTGSTRSRSRRKKKEKELSRLDSKRRSASEDNLSVRNSKKQRSGRSRKKYDGNISDDFSGSEYSQKRSRRKGGRQSDTESKSNRRDISDNESVRSRTKRAGDKPKGTYSSYYEY